MHVPIGMLTTRHAMVTPPRDRAQRRSEAVLCEMLEARGTPVHRVRMVEALPGEPSTWDVNDTMLVFFCTTQKLNIDRIKTYIACLDAMHRSYAIIIHSHVITPSTRRLLEHLQRFTVELFSQQELQYNLTRHVLYRPHRKLEGKELEVVTSRYATVHMPVLSKDDPVSRFFRFRRGDVIEVRRPCGPFYRVVK